MEKMKDYIAVFDSGLGGISVLRELVKELPEEKFYYWGDSRHTPYGDKSLKEVQDRTMEAINNFRAKGAKAVVVACNTATSAAITIARNVYADMPIIGIEPALKPAAQADDNARILVLATANTLKLDKYHKLYKAYGKGLTVHEVACVGLAEAIEDGDAESEEVKALLHKYLDPYKDKVDSVVLGCTHYPFVQDQIADILGDVTIYDGAEGTARQLRRELEAHDLLAKEGEGDVKLDSSLPEAVAVYEKFLNL